jgi:DNA-binding MarR family transcriptional regulator
MLLSELVDSGHRLARIAAVQTRDATSTSTWRVLAALEGAGPVRVGELAAACRVTPPTMTGLVAGLVKTGWVQRVADPSDARAGLVAITGDGLDAIESRRVRTGDALAPYFADLDESEATALATVVDLVARRTASADPLAAPSTTPTLSLTTTEQDTQ